jgi:Flp pilus assembly protein TadD/Pyruvate/2-oxoacid:ferredoxin oxidoreductase delta subunit
MTKNADNKRSTSESATSNRCGTRSPSADISLPVSSQTGGRKIKRSKMGPRRAIVLIGVHVVMVAHFLHYYVSGRTLSPIEPSESMYTLELGQVNAGFIFFVVALLATAVFGRFMCGWGCHLVAYQDLCAWLMKTLGVKPKPFRSRLLVFVPLGLAVYMFVYPSVRRVVAPATVSAFPGFSNHLVTADFWKTFPDPLFAVITVIGCGVVAVYVLGAKGFCTYGCPYGGFFGLTDKVAIGQILVNDNCEQCGHCTAVCTSNVRVNEEVKAYGMVVDPGCMKCMDCVSVCPNDALRYGFAKPTVLRAKPTTAPKSRVYDFARAEDLVLAVVFLLTTASFRGLYDRLPLLLSVALGGVTAYLLLKLWRVVVSPTVRVQNLRIKTAGRVTGTGFVVIGVIVMWSIFTVHSGFVQWHRVWGRHYLNLTEATPDDVFSGRFLSKTYSPQHDENVDKSRKHFAMADAWGLADTVEVKLGLSWNALLEGDDAAAERFAREAVAASPERATLWEELSKILERRGDLEGAIEAVRRAIELGEPSAANHFRLAVLLTQVNRWDEAVDAYEECIVRWPHSAEARHNLGGLLGRMGRYDEAIGYLLAALDIAPDDADTYDELGLALAAAGRVDEAIRAFQSAIELAPDHSAARFHLNTLLQGRRRPVEPGPPDDSR